MSSSDYGEAGPHVYEIAEELRTNFTIQGNPYNNIMLDIDQPNFTSTHDPEIVITRDAATLFWPGGSPVHGGSFETVAFESADAHQEAAEVITIRNALLSSSIGSAALGRVPEDMRTAWEVVRRQLAPQPPILHAIMRCTALDLPLTVCQTSTVIESQTIPAGLRIMHLWYPNYLSPKPVLAKLRQAVRKAIEAETL